MIVQEIKNFYGENLTENIGKTHDYLRMTFDFSFTKEVKVNMWDYLRKVIKEFSEEITGVCATPAGDHPFKVHDDWKEAEQGASGSISPYSIPTPVRRKSSAARYPNSGVFSHHLCEGP